MMPSFTKGQFKPFLILEEQGNLFCKDENRQFQQSLDLLLCSQQQLPPQVVRMPAARMLSQTFQQAILGVQTLRLAMLRREGL